MLAGRRWLAAGVAKPRPRARGVSSRRRLAPVESLASAGLPVRRSAPARCLVRRRGPLLVAEG
eukprot:2957069-Pyramimonas_sp.AAC.1